MNIATPSRLDALDVARFIAFVGMVVVNFSVVVDAHADTGSWSAHIAAALQGRAAATFVVLAGLGLGLADRRATAGISIGQTLRRGVFLLALGLLNMMIFEADIIHYYAFYFVFGMVCLRASTKAIGLAIAGLVLGFVVLLFVFDYNAGWDWQTLSYQGFWTLPGFVRNLMFNGWHPVVPWLGFFLFGALLARLDLATAQVQKRLLVIGAVTLAATSVVSFALMTQFPADTYGDLSLFFGTSPVPPMPLYMAAGMATAALVIGLCLRLSRPMARLNILTALAVPGRQTLTLYFLHIYVGMAALEGLGYLAKPGAETTAPASLPLGAALVFSVIALIYAHVWSRFFKRGPIEALMRRLAG